MAKGKRHLGLATATIVPVVALLAASVVASDPHERAMYSLVERSRTKHVLTSLEIHPGLAEMAERQATRMAGTERIWHNPRLVEEMRATGAHWRRVGENVGSGFDLERIQTALMKSPSHRRNLLDARFNAIGIGVAESHDERLYITQVFAWIEEAEPEVVAPEPTPETYRAEDGSSVERSFYTSTREAAPSTPSTAATRDACESSSKHGADPSSATASSSGTQDLQPAK